MDTVAFPHLGLTFHVDPDAFTLFGVTVKWYGIILTLGILAAFLVLRYNAKKREDIPEDHLYNLALVTVPVSLIGARVFYVLTKWGEYRGDFLAMINIRNGGLAIYGGVIFGVVTVLLYAKIKKLSALRLMDAAAPGLMLAQVIGRWGNFVNMEAFGEYTDSLFAMRLPMAAVHSSNITELMRENKELIDGITFIQAHPTFLYESCWNLVGVALLLFLIYPRKKFDGQIICLYLGWYGLGRTWIELLRTDSLYLFEGLLGQTIKISVLIGVLSVLFCLIAMPLLYKKSKKLTASEGTYTAKFKASAIEAVSEEATEESEEPSVPETEEIPPEENGSAES